MAKYDVFISYSRLDSKEVAVLIELLRDSIPAIQIWYDIEGIETAEIFQSKIIKAIDNSSLMVFACSDNSLNSEYCRKEVMYAKNSGKKVAPYLLKDAKLKDWFLFEFGLVNCINSQKEQDVTHLINDIRNWKLSATDNSISNTIQQPILQVERKKKPWWKRRSFKFTLMISVSFCLLACVFTPFLFVTKTGGKPNPQDFDYGVECPNPSFRGNPHNNESIPADRERYVPCDLCNGTGIINDNVCPLCKGDGVYLLLEHRKIDTIR